MKERAELLLSFGENSSEFRKGSCCNRSASRLVSLLDGSTTEQKTNSLHPHTPATFELGDFGQVPSHFPRASLLGCYTELTEALALQSSGED